MSFPSFLIEDRALQLYNAVAGVDEVGRGCLCGPVVAGMVVITNHNQYVYGVKDSKQLTAPKREQLAEVIKATVASYGIGSASAEEIDTQGIMKATQLAMLRAYWQLKIVPDVILQDGEKTTLPLLGKTFQFVAGDAKYYSIAAASVIAKVYRDDLMRNVANEYPNYDFENNKGYGTDKHIQALRQLGPTPIHRKTFLKFLSESAR